MAPTVVMRRASRGKARTPRFGARRATCAGAVVEASRARWVRLRASGERRGEGGVSRRIRAAGAVASCREIFPGGPPTHPAGLARWAREGVAWVTATADMASENLASRLEVRLSYPRRRGRASRSGRGASRTDERASRVVSHAQNLGPRGGSIRPVADRTCCQSGTLDISTSHDSSMAPAGHRSKRAQFSGFARESAATKPKSGWRKDVCDAVPPARAQVRAPLNAPDDRGGLTNASQQHPDISERILAAPNLASPWRRSQER